MKDYLVSADNIIDMLDECTCSFTTVLKSIEILRDNGFTELSLDGVWSLQKGKKYYINIYDSSLFAFSIGEDFTSDSKLRVLLAHTDHPCLYIKPNPEMKNDDYISINVETYGGLILNTWLDRPLSAAGKVIVKSDDVFSPGKKIVDLKKSLFTIPNLAIHQNREINKGIELSKQKDMIPLCGMVEDELNKNNYFIQYLAKSINVSPEDILDFEMYIYNNDIPEIIGLNDEFISSPRLDNVTSVVACVKAITEATRGDGLNIIAIYDNEEIGSSTKQGANSNLFAMIIERVYMGLGYGRAEYLNAITSGFMLSVDVAHGEHPNKMEKSDLTNKNPLNGGIVIKKACSQTYATDSESTGILEQLCQKNDIPYQKFISNSNIPTGSTLGNFVNRQLPMRMVDIGVPVLAMHSARELMGSKDQRALEKLLFEFFSDISSEK